MLLGVGGGTAWVVSGGFGADSGSGGGGGSAAAEPKEWAVPFVNADSSNFDASIGFGTWMSDSAAIRAQKDGVLAYDLKTGKRAWGVPSPTDNLCGATSEIEGGLGAIAYGTEAACDHLAGIDVKTGKLTWKIKIPAEPKSRLTMNVPTLLLAGDVVIAKVGNSVYAYGLADGKKLWGGSPADGCRPDGLGGSAEQLVVTVDCGVGSHVSGLDPKTGKPKWRSEIAAEGLSHLVLSAKPAVVATTSGDSTTVEVVDESGKARQFVAGERIDLLALNGENFTDGEYERYRVALHGNTLYLATFPENVPGKLRSRDYALAYDMTTGKRLWKSTGTNDTMLSYVRADDHGLLALETGDRRDLAPRLVRIDAATGKATALAELPQKYGHEGEKARVFEKNGAVVIMPPKAVAADYAVVSVRTAAQ
ncbi:PQQ-binding-like beta-propeller repeat protein [Streptosporangium sp. NPDC000396]|uniref:outer membrane protein assembly factor BamB family protein n=1 Tax=Streptosporangium sp. NPDC000396 TaxID=3366185 RepID=UPI00369A4414